MKRRYTARIHKADERYAMEAEVIPNTINTCSGRWQGGNHCVLGPLQATTANYKTSGES
jgi:hypothetical protein